MNELTWKEGMNRLQFPPLNAQVTDGQQMIINNLIDSMNLMEADM